MHPHSFAYDAYTDRCESDTPKYEAADATHMTEDDEPEATYDPQSPTPPAREPPRRNTAPQSEYTMGQVGFGIVVLAIGLAVTFALPILLG